MILFVWPQCQFDNTLYKSCTTEGGSMSDSKHYTLYINVSIWVKQILKLGEKLETYKSLPKNVSVEMNHIYFYI